MAYCPNCSGELGGAPTPPACTNCGATFGPGSAWAPTPQPLGTFRKFQPPKQDVGPTKDAEVMRSGRPTNPLIDCLLRMLAGEIALTFAALILFFPALSMGALQTLPPLLAFGAIAVLFWACLPLARWRDFRNSAESAAETTVTAAIVGTVVVVLGTLVVAVGALVLLFVMRLGVK